MPSKSRASKEIRNFNARYRNDLDLNRRPSKSSEDVHASVKKNTSYLSKSTGKRLAEEIEGKVPVDTRSERRKALERMMMEGEGMKEREDAESSTHHDTTRNLTNLTNFLPASTPYSTTTTLTPAIPLPPTPTTPANPFTNLQTPLTWRSAPDRWSSLTHSKPQIPNIRANPGHKGVQTKKEWYEWKGKWDVDSRRGGSVKRKGGKEGKKSGKGKRLGLLMKDGSVREVGGKGEGRVGEDDKENSRHGGVCSGREWDKGKEKDGALWRSALDGKGVGFVARGKSL